MKRFDQSKNYKDFVTKRDEHLEHILRVHRLKITDIIDEAFVVAVSVIQSKFQTLVNNQYDSQKIKQVESQIDYAFDQAVHKIVFEQLKLRRVTYMLAHAGEAEAIAQTLKAKIKVNLNKNDINKKIYGNLPDNTDLIKRIKFYFSDVKRKMISSLEQSILFGDTPSEMLGRVILSLPRRKAMPAKPVLKKVVKAKVSEASKPKFSGDEDGVSIEIGPRGGVTIGQFDWDNGTWGEVLSRVDEDYSLVDRSPKKFFDATDPTTKTKVREDIPEKDKVYAWELEQQITHDFVNSVRQGQVDAANANGISEFIWIAILDDRTCEHCCEWRSGLLTSEIEKTLASSPDLKDHCDVIVPPAHFNCRCGIAPVAKLDLSDINSEITTKDFDAWLNGE